MTVVKHHSVGELQELVRQERDARVAVGGGLDLRSAATGRDLR